MGAKEQGKTPEREIFDINKIYLTSSLALGSILSITDERVRQLEDKGLIKSENIGRKKYFDLIESINAYYEYRNSGQTTVSIEEAAQLDIRYRKAKTEKMELELSELKGQMHRAEDIEMIMGDMVSGIRAELTALPGRLAVDCANAANAAEASAIIKDAVLLLLDDLTKYQYDPSKYAELVRDREKWMYNVDDEEDTELPKKSIKATDPGRTKTAKRSSGKPDKAAGTKKRINTAIGAKNGKGK